MWSAMGAGGRHVKLHEVDPLFRRQAGKAQNIMQVCLHRRILINRYVHFNILSQTKPDVPFAVDLKVHRDQRL